MLLFIRLQQSLVLIKNYVKPNIFIPILIRQNHKEINTKGIIGVKDGYLTNLNCQ